MNEKIFFGSLARVSDLESREFECEPIPRNPWETGDYVVGAITIPRGRGPVRLVKPTEDLGATLEFTMKLERPE